MPRGKDSRGGKRGHKGGRRHFTDPQALEQARIKQAKEKEWRKQRGELSESDEEEKEEGAAGSDNSSDEESGNDVAFKKGDKSSSEESSSEEEEEDKKPKGAESLIEIENPNRVQQKQKKVTALDTEDAQGPKAAGGGGGGGGAGGKPQLSRREREEVEKQRAKAHYQKLHAQGKTEEARADLARLAIIRKQREDAAKKREEEKKAKEEAAKAKADKTKPKK